MSVAIHDISIQVTDIQMQTLMDFGFAVLAEGIQYTVVTNWEVGDEFYLHHKSSNKRCWVRVVAKQGETNTLTTAPSMRTLIIVAPAINRGSMPC